MKMSPPFRGNDWSAIGMPYGRSWMLKNWFSAENSAGGVEKFSAENEPRH